MLKGTEKITPSHITINFAISKNDIAVRKISFQERVVQRIVSLTTSLRCQLVKNMPTTLSNTLFYVRKCENLKRISHFSNKNKGLMYL